jgi:hypothetical protein
MRTRLGQVGTVEHHLNRAAVVLVGQIADQIEQRISDLGHTQMNALPSAPGGRAPRASRDRSQPSTVSFSRRRMAHSASELVRYWRPKALADSTPHETEKAAEFRPGPFQLDLYA